MTASDVQANEAVSPAIVPATPSGAARVLSMLTLAFAADPPTRWMFPDAEQHISCFPRLAQALGGAAFARHTAFTANDGAGAALWLPPDAHPDEDALAALVVENVAPRERSEVFAVFDEIGRRHPAKPHWYLPLIGVDPSRQGHGLGAALLRPVLAECDAAQSLAYLESTNPRNRPFYERHGFEAVGEIKVGRCPPITAMLRRPKAPGRAPL
jgi:GNAT superfamily N-acetyltransferase